MPTRARNPVPRTPGERVLLDYLGEYNAHFAQRIFEVGLLSSRYGWCVYLSMERSCEMVRAYINTSSAWAMFLSSIKSHSFTSGEFKLLLDGCLILRCEVRIGCVVPLLAARRFSTSESNSSNDCRTFGSPPSRHRFDCALLPARCCSIGYGIHF